MNIKESVQQKWPLFNKRRKSRVDTTWKHKFVCFAFKDQTKIPVSIVEKEQLLRCGLGEKEIEFSELDMNADQFKQVLLTEFPSLNKAGGYQFLKCLPKIGSFTSSCSQLTKTFKTACWNFKDVHTSYPN